jgi:dihydrofolate synthase / folylpolyglutamate synthase
VTLERLFGRRTDGIRLELETITAVHEALGRPAADIPAVHVVGTNGKGSVAALIEHALLGRDHRVGLYTSPHLMRVTERVRVDGIEVTQAVLTAAVDRVLAVEATTSLPRPLSFFEIITLAALWHMAETHVEVLVAEAGLGGRLDATRLVNARVVAVTSIDLDHQAFLGGDLASIATEKAAVLRTGVPCISAPQHPIARQVVQAHARAVGAPLTVVEPASRAPRGLPGEHQRINAAVALQAARVIDPSVQPEDLDGVSWPGRLEWVPRGDAGVLFDAAHNPAGIDALVRFVETSGKALDLSNAVVLFGCAPDKDRDAMLVHLRRLGRPIWWVPTPGCARTDAPADAARTFTGWDDPSLLTELEGHLTRDPAIVCGSHTLVGPLRSRWMGDSGTPDPTDPRSTPPR